jgi:NAD(P)-dependent dehydrogenase (short-subunit alcohol dehydrogenase family)
MSTTTGFSARTALNEFDHRATCSDKLLPDAAGKVALVTGAAGGIGGAIARGFADAGATVVAADLDAADGQAAPRLHPRCCDVTSEKAVAALEADIAKQFGRLDYLVNAAGVVAGGTITEMSLAQWRRVIDVNLTSCFLLARAFHPALAASRGVVVLLGSSNGVNGGSALSGAAYAVAKAGVHNLTRHLAKAWAADGIRVNALAPGPIDTKMVTHFDAATRTALEQTIPLGRYGTAQEVAANALFLCSRHAAWQTGTIVDLSGGLAL